MFLLCHALAHKRAPGHLTLVLTCTARFGSGAHRGHIAVLSNANFLLLSIHVREFRGIAQHPSKGNVPPLPCSHSQASTAALHTRAHVHRKIEDRTVSILNFCCHDLQNTREALPAHHTVPVRLLVAVSFACSYPPPSRPWMLRASVPPTLFSTSCCSMFL